MSINAIFIKVSIDVNIKTEGGFSSFLDVIYNGLIFSRILIRLLSDRYLLWRHSPPNNCNNFGELCVYLYDGVSLIGGINCMVLYNELCSLWEHRSKCPKDSILWIRVGVNKQDKTFDFQRLKCI